MDGVAPERDSALLSWPQKKRTPGAHLWRGSNPTSRAVLLVDRGAGLQKSQSAQNLTSDAPHSPAPSSDRGKVRQRPQHLFMDPRPSPHLSSASSGSPQSPQSPLPWESPKLKPQRSYMSPTTSSKAKSSRSSSLGEGIQMGTPPASPSFPKRRRSSGLEVEPPLFTPSISTYPSSLSSSSPLLCTLSNSPSPSPTPPHPTATVSTNPGLTCLPNVPPSRIPLPKQSLSPRRSLCLEMKTDMDWSGSQSRTSSPSGDPGGDAAPTPGNRAAPGKRLSLSFDPALPSSLPVKQKKGSVSESASEPGQVAVAKERPLVPVQAHTLPADPQPDLSITLETCRQVVADLHSSLRRTIMLYTTVLSPEPSKDQQEMRMVLSEALGMVQAELDSLPRLTSHPGGARQDLGVSGEGGKALALLEQYSELLLKSVEKRLDSKT